MPPCLKVYRGKSIRANLVNSSAFLLQSSANSPFAGIHANQNQGSPTDSTKLKPEKRDFNFAVPSGRAPGRKEKRNYVSNSPDEAPLGFPMNWSDSQSPKKNSLKDNHSIKDLSLEDTNSDFRFNFGDNISGTKFSGSGFSMFADGEVNFSNEADKDANAFSNFMSTNKGSSSSGTSFESLFEYEDKSTGDNSDQTKGSFQFTF